MWHLATAHAQTLHFGWAYNRVKIPLCKNFEAKEGMGLFSRGYGTSDEPELMVKITC